MYNLLRSLLQAASPARAGLRLGVIQASQGGRYRHRCDPSDEGLTLEERLIRVFSLMS